jgi:menaquinol-cytochrome c reductase iron-sulfur subunit
MASSSHIRPPQGPPTATDRRGFLARGAALAIGDVVGLVPMLAGLAVFFDPLRRKHGSGKFIRVTALDSLPDDGIPRQFPIIAEHLDAWNWSLEPIGAVYLRRGQGQATPECLTATCPHAGCFVNYDSLTNSYKCPCHNSTFRVDGQIIEPSPSPRPMDSLECKVQEREILVQFEKFYSGKTDKVAVQ